MTPSNNEILEAREFLRSRILRRAEQEGTPLSQLEIDYLDSDHLPNEREIMDRFEQEFDFQNYIERIAGFLRRSMENEVGAVADAKARYEEMVKRLEDSTDDFMLWSCSVMGVAEPAESKTWLVVVVVLLLAALAAYLSAKWQGLIP